MNYLTVDEIETLCKGAIKGKDKLYTNLTLDGIRNYLNNTIEPNIANGDADKKEKFKAIKEICNKAIALLGDGVEVRELISGKEINKLENQIRMNYMLDPRSTQEKAEEALKEKNKPYKYFFTEEEIISILSSSGSGEDSNINVERMPEELISAVEKVFTAKNQSYKALIKKLNPNGGTRAKSMSDYSAFCASFEKILKENSEGRRDVDRDVSDDAALELNNTVVPQIEKYYNACTEKASSWKAVSYLLMFPELMGMLSNAKKIEDSQADGMIELVKHNLGLKNINEAKDVIKTLAPHFDVEIPMSKFGNASGNGYNNGGNGNDGYSSADGAARLQLTRFIKQLENCLNGGTIPLEALNEAISELDIWETTFPDEPEIDKYRSLIDDAKAKRDKADSMIMGFEQIYPDMKQVTDAAVYAANDLRRIKNGATVPITQWKATKETFDKIHEMTVQFWGDITVKDSIDEVVNKLGSLRELLDIAATLHNNYSGEVIDEIDIRANELYSNSNINDVCYFNSNYTNLGLPVPKKVIVIAAILILVFFPFGWILLLSLAIFYVVNEIGKKKQWDKNTIITRSVIIAVSVCAVILSVGLIKDIRKKLANKQNNKAEASEAAKESGKDGGAAKESGKDGGAGTVEAPKEVPKDYSMLSDLGEEENLVYYKEVSDNIGTKYTNGVGGRNSDNLNYQDYALNKEYVRLTGRVVLNRDCLTQNGDDVCLWIYGDGNKLYKSESVTAGCMPQDIDIDISGISQLRVEIQGSNMLRLVDCCLYKKAGMDIVTTAEINTANYQDVCRLADMECYNKHYNAFRSIEMVKDNHENEYSDAVSGSNGYDVNWEEYYIDKYYSRMEGKVILNYERRENPSTDWLVWIYGDGELLYQSEPLTPDSEPQSFSLDISGVDILRVEIYGADTAELVDTQLYK